MRKFTKRAQHLLTVIQNNKHLFQSGSVITRTQFCTLMGIPEIKRFDSCQAERRFVSRLSYYVVYVNRLLAARGIHLKSQNYYSSLLVTTGNYVEHMIHRNEVLAHNAHVRIGLLTSGRDNFKSTWSTMKNKELLTVSGMYK